MYFPIEVPAVHKSALQTAFRSAFPEAEFQELSATDAGAQFGLRVNDSRKQEVISLFVEFCEALRLRYKVEEPGSGPVPWTSTSGAGGAQQV